jgi:nitrogen-specific signal transduction histidine kinase
VIKIFAKESKLIVIFFLTVIVLGSLLVYLSIQNISTFKELTEKKISEEERGLAGQYTLDFQKELEKLVLTFEDLVSKDSIINKHWIKDLDTVPLIKQIIKINKNGAFLWPHFSVANSTTKKESPTFSYLEKIKTAEYSEFADQDYLKAEDRYISALKGARNKSDSAYVFNAISRLYLKMKQTEKAFTNYSLILSNFGHTTNSSGFPYAYYSVNQLLKIPKSEKNEALKKLLVSFLSSLSEGSIVLNHSTTDLLVQISEWTEQQEKDADILKIEALVEHITDQLSLIDNYKQPIAELLIGGNVNPTEMFLGNYVVLKPLSGSTHELLLFNKNSMEPNGFVVTIEPLFDSVKQHLFSDLTAFEYHLALVKNEGQHHLSTNGLINYFEFSPYFNDYRLKIVPKNAQVVEDYVFKRKIIFGIGFLLVLGVMAIGLNLLVQDIKRKKQMERLRADFVSNVTHELKTPLTSIHMFAESILIGRVPSGPGLKKYANIIVKESNKLQRMINNILDFSRKENNKLVYQLKETDLSDLVHTTMDEMNYWLEISNFKVVLEIEQPLLAKVHPEGVKQALSNLISNAIKYSQTNRKLIVRLLKKENRALIEVEDFGIGIPREKLNLIFEKFYRVNSVENESASGTGLGLTVTRDIIEAQNGELRVESTLSKGSKFTIVFPI